MDNSQSSDVFSDSGGNSFEKHAQMDIFTYEDLVARTKLLLSKNMKAEVQKSSYSELFAAILDDCGTCIAQGLELVISLLSKPEVNLHQLCEYLDSAVNILHQLCGFFTEVIECQSMSFTNAELFPTATGRIIMTVFTHCKDRIGEIVQTLDVKTMAEQWKAYTMICEKHSQYLKDTHIFEDCTIILCKMTRNNIRNAVEMDQEDKMVVRSLKVASFTMKILLRMCNIFKLATNKNFEHIMELLLYIYMNSPAYLESMSGKSTQFTNLINNNVLNPVELLLKELLIDEKFVDYLCKYSIENTAKDDKLLSYILIIISTIKLILQGTSKGIKHKIMRCIYQWLPYGHIWFNMGLKFKSNSCLTFGLYEHLLTHTFAMASMFDAEEMAHLEQKMYESLLGVECYSALFTSNLWELLARSSSRQYLSSQVLYLCKIYQTLEQHQIFPRSPQQTHLRQTILRLFKILHPEDKARISKQFKNTDENITDLLIILKNEKPDHTIEKLKTMFLKLFSAEFEDREEIVNFVNIMKMAATLEHASKLEDDITKVWMKMCPQNNKNLLSPTCPEFVEALVSLTMALKFSNSANFVKVLHVVSTMIEKGNTELQLALINLLLNLAKNSCRDENMHVTENLLIKTFKVLLQETDSNVKNKFWTQVWTHRKDPSIDSIISKTLIQNPLLQENWNKLSRNEIELVRLKDNLTATMDFKYDHKCIKTQTVIEESDSDVVIQKTNSNNFDFADLDTLFEVESDSEPACKKAKLEFSAAEEILVRLENDVSLLCSVEDKVFSSDCKVRIRVLCEKLIGIIE